MDEITKIWPKWEIAEILGKGTFGNVYKVHKHDLGMECYAAVKVIHIPQDEMEVIELQNTGMDDLSIRSYYKDVLNGLTNEIQIMEKLKTAGNIVSIEDYMMVEDEAKLGGTLYIRMELLESLGNYVRKNKGLNVEEIVKMGIDICSALECCEQNHTIHRDIKPGNIFRNPYGAYKLGDFGISKQMEGTQSVVRSTVGTRMYMAPEIYRGESYGNTVDIYALGITMYWLLNNRRFPFLPKESQPIGPKVLEEAAASLISGKELESPVNGDTMLAYIVKKACAFQAQERYQSAAEMKGDLWKWQMEKKFSSQSQDEPLLDTEFQEPKTYRAFPVKPPDNGMTGQEEPPGGGGKPRDPDGPGIKPADPDEPGKKPADTDGPNARVSDVSEFIKGNIVTFGAYYQDAKDREKTPIEWEVIDKQGDVCLLLSRYVLDYQPYHHNVKEKVSWGMSSLRKWLNEDFRDSSFTREEREALYLSTLENADYINKTKTKTFLPETWDEVFCLSFEETEKQYSFSERDYQVYATDYTLHKMSGSAQKDTPVSWWLRSANQKKGKALIALPEGYVGFFPPLTSEYNGVRPAIRVNISKLKQR